MKEEQQRIKIAEACGYVWDNGRIGVCGWWTDPSGLQVSWGQNKLKAMSQLLIIDYLNDLNAMHDAEKVLTEEQRIAYTNHTYDIACKVQRETEKWRWISLTAAQRAEAFLRTLGLWEEGE